MRDKILWDSQQEGSIGGGQHTACFVSDLHNVSYGKGTGDWQKRYWHCIRMPY